MPRLENQEERSSRLLPALVLALCTAATSMASTITVTSLADDGSTGTLRYAIANAAANDTIQFSVSGNLTLVLGQLNISKNLSIHGPGATLLSVSGNDATRVFQVDSGVKVTILGITIQHGRDPNAGGGINNAGQLTIISTVISNNSIFNTGSNGAGIYNSGTLSITNTTFSTNSADDGAEDALGGGIANFGTVTVNNSTFLGNYATAGGAGILNGGILTLTNSTFFGNHAPFGSGLLNGQYGTARVTNSTFSNNYTSSGPRSGAGIYNDIYAAATVKGTLLANNSPGGNCANNASINSGGYNLSDDDSCSSLFTQPGDMNNTPAGLDTMGLQSNGGPTQTVGLLITAPALNVIPASPMNECTDTAGNALTTDQRGVTRPQGGSCDIGAFELAGNTPTAMVPIGTNVVVEPVDPATHATPVNLTFSDVVQAGTSALSISGSGTPLPNGFNLGSPPTYFGISTNATYAGPISICINYAGISFHNQNQLAIWHYDTSVGSWVLLTTTINTSTTTACATTASLSPFVLLEPVYQAYVQQPINPDGSSIFSVKRGVVPVKFTLSFGNVLTCSLPAATIALTRTAGGTIGSIDESVYLIAADSGSNFRIDSANCQYAYNLGSSALGTGTYEVDILINGSVVGKGIFGLQ